MPLDEVAGDNRLRAYTGDEKTTWNLETRGIRDGSVFEEEFEPGAAMLTRRFMCDWDKRYDVITWLVGDYPTTYSDSGTTKISRIMPQRHPEFSNWIATKIVSCTPFKFIGDQFDGDDGVVPTGAPTHLKADLVVQYEPTPFTLKDDADTSLEEERYISKEGYPDTEVQGTTTYQTFPGGIMRFTRDGGGGFPHNKQVAANIGIPQNEETFSWIWRRLPMEVFEAGSTLRERYHGDPAAGTKGWVGSVNKSYDPIGRPPGTCMLMRALPVRRLDPTGVGYVIDLKLDFLYRPQGHFFFYAFNPDGTGTGNGYYEVTTDATYRDPSVMPDDKTLHHVREWASPGGLFDID